MSNVDDFVKMAKGFVNKAGQKAGEAVEVSKLKINQMKTGSELQSAFETLGELFYEFSKTGADNRQKIDECIQKIDTLHESLDDNGKKIDETMHKITCPNCGTTNEEGAVYCIKCGIYLKGVEYSSSADNDESNV